MSCHWSEAREEIFARIVRTPHLLLCTDFDGALAPIVEHPSQAELSQDMRRVLLALSTHEWLTVAVVSGRERAGLQARVDIPGLIYAGNHGLEINGPGFLFVEPTAQAHRDALQQVATDLATRLQPIAGAFVEDKGLTLSVHFRRVPAENQEEVRRIVHSTLAGTSHPFLLTTGDKVYELRPRVYWDKGAAVGWIQDQLGIPNILTIFLGDDNTDEDAFAALPDDITVRVGGGVETAARYHLDGQAEVQGFLEWLVDQVRRRPLAREVRRGKGAANR